MNKSFTIMGMVILGALLAAMTVVLMSSCTASTPLTTGNPPIVRWVDEEAGVVCWVFYEYHSGGPASGISCLPIGDTNLGHK